MRAMLTIIALLLPTLAIANDALVQADAQYQKGNLAKVKASLPLYQQAVKDEPDSFEANWKAAQAHREFANLSKEQQAKGWKKTCASYGKQGMGYASKAIKLEPKKPHGHLLYGSSVGNYSDGVSIVTALTEGLKGKTQTAFETAYKLDKMHKDAGPILALGRFWSVLPWPMKDNDKAIKYLREYRTHFPANAEGQVYLAEVLIDEGGDKNKAEAREILGKAVKSSIPFYQKRAKKLLGEL